MRLLMGLQTSEREQVSDSQLINQLINYHRDRIDEITSPAERLESIPFHLAAVELLARLDEANQPTINDIKREQEEASN